MLTIKETQNYINQYFTKIKWDIEPQGLYAPVEYILSFGGKKVRPTLTVLAANLFAEDINPALPAAAAIEIFHNFTLMHDDIMDRAPLRRNQPTVHTKWNDNTAILSGDAMMIKAYQYMAQVPENKLKECLSVFSQTAIEVCEGQQFDVEFENRNDVSADEYLEMIRLKTAVLLGASLKIGAIVGGADTANAQRLYDFGVNIGLAFQLKDDLLDVYGNPETFGKQVGGDILCNKKTYLLINALDKATSTQTGKLQQWLSLVEPKNPQEKVEAVTAIFNEIGIKAICEEKMDEYYAKAMACLQQVMVPEERKQHLVSLAEELMKREN